MEHLATFVQISDLHYGPETAIPEPLPWAPKSLRFRGHSPQALENVAIFLESLGGETGVPPRLILTGDLTSFGEERQFALVTDFLGPPPSPSGEPSLNLPNWKEYTIPGNHDHYPGEPRFTGPTTTAFYSTFDPMPDATTVCPLENGLLVRFLRIDTDANVGPDSSLDRVRAIGRFKAHVQQFSNALAALPSSGEIRVLLLHHSAMYRGLMFQIHKESRSALDEFIKKHDIALLLCGHTHKAGLEMYDAGGTEALEARCGTTAQRSWRRSLLVHKLMFIGSRVFWEVQVFVESRNEALGFEPAAKFRSRGPVVKTIPVWPRP